MVVCLYTTTSLFAQNLIPNGDFEEISECPDNLDQIDRAPPWRNPTAGSPDLFNICNDSVVGVPSNFIGTQPPQSGSGYAGLISKMGNRENYREYIQVALKEKLIKGKRYYFRMYVSKADKDNLLDNKLGILLTDSLFSSHNSEYLAKTPQIVTKVYFSDKDGWTLFETQYEATGTERVLTIGNFTNPNSSGPDGESDDDLGQGENDQCYLYIDNVFLGDCQLSATPKHFLGSDTLICSAEKLNVKVNAKVPITGISYLWSTGDTTPFIFVKKTDTIRVTLISPYCAIHDTLIIRQTPPPKVNLGPDQTVCEGTAVKFTALNANASRYRWINDTQMSTFTTTKPGIVWVDVTVKGCTTRDSVMVTHLQKPVLELGKNRAVCNAPPYLLSPETTNSAYTYKWNTQEPGMAISVNHSGKYWVEATYMGCTTRDTVTVSFSDLYRFNLGSDTTLCSSNPLLLNAQRPGITQYYWNTGSTAPAIQAHKSGNYWVIAVDSLCQIKDEVQVTFLDAPVVEIGNDTLICEGSKLVLQAGNPDASCLWHDGSTGHTYIADAPGYYKVTVSRNGCSVSDGFILNTMKAPLIELGNDTALCEGDVLQLEAYRLGASYLWSDGSRQSHLAIQQSGSYRVLVQSGACLVNDSIRVTFYTKPVIHLGNDTSLCFNEPFELHAYSPHANAYEWQDKSSQPVFHASGEGIYRVILRNEGCRFSDDIRLFQLPRPEVDLGLNRMVCKSEPVILKAGKESDLVEWNNGMRVPSITVYPPGNYAVTVTGQNGCKVIDQVSIDTFPVAQIFQSVDTVLCSGSSFELCAPVEFSNIIWNELYRQKSMLIQKAGLYRVSALDEHRCPANDAIMVSVKPLPEISIPSEIRTCNPSFRLELSTPFQTYLWSDGSNLPYFDVTGWGTIHLTVTDFNLCSADKSIEILNGCEPHFYIPNAFTPNDDGLNDQIIPVVNNVESFRFEIYNRWGELMFATSEPGKGWDGKQRNGHALTDTYVYKLHYVNFDHIAQVSEGNFTLLR